MNDKYKITGAKENYQCGIKMILVNTLDCTIDQGVC